MSRDGANLGSLIRLLQKHIITTSSLSSSSATALRSGRGGGGAASGLSSSSSTRSGNDQIPTLLVLRDSNGAVFGGFVTDTWRDHGERYYGSGTAAVWSFVSGGLQVMNISIRIRE